MDFGLSEDQLMLEATVHGFLKERVPISRVRELREQPCPNDRKVWNELAELGVTGILIPEIRGGIEFTLLDAALVSQSLGYAVTPTPFLTSGVMVPVALGAVDVDDASGWLGGIASGELAFGLAVTETRRAVVVAPSAALAEALSTALVVLETSRGIALAEATPGVEARIETEDGKPGQTSGWRRATRYRALRDSIEKADSKLESGGRVADEEARF